MKILFLHFNNNEIRVDTLRDITQYVSKRSQCLLLPYLHRLLVVQTYPLCLLRFLQFLRSILQITRLMIVFQFLSQNEQLLES